MRRAGVEPEGSGWNRAVYLNLDTPEAVMCLLHLLTSSKVYRDTIDYNSIVHNGNSIHGKNGKHDDATYRGYP